MLDPYQLANRVTTRNLTWPCGCTVWKFGRSSGINPCPMHFVVHSQMDEKEVFARTPLKCECPKCLAERESADPYEWVADRYEEEVIEKKKSFVNPDRMPAPSISLSEAPVQGELFVEVMIDKCGCCWEQCNDIWKLTKACKGDEPNVFRLEVQRNQPKV